MTNPNWVKGYKHTEEWKNHMRKLMKGRVFTKEWREKLSLKAKQRIPTKNFLGKHHSEEAKRKISEANKGNRAWNKGKPNLQWQGKNNPRWNNGINKLNDGSILVRQPNHPFCHKDRGYVYEHRLVMEKKIGRLLKPNEVIHHINKDRSDNRIENLILFKNQADHLKFHKSLSTNKG